MLLSFSLPNIIHLHVLSCSCSWPTIPDQRRGDKVLKNHGRLPCCCLLASLLVCLTCYVGLPLSPLLRPLRSAANCPPPLLGLYNVLLLLLCFLSGFLPFFGGRQPHVRLLSAVCRYDPSSTKRPNFGPPPQVCHLLSPFAAFPHVFHLSSLPRPVRFSFFTIAEF